LLLRWCAACAGPPTAIDVGGVGSFEQTAGAAVAQFDWTDYAAVLRRVVVDGRVEYRRLIEDSTDLDRTLARMATAGPSTRPEAFAARVDRLSYWINAHNATVLRAATEQLRRQGVTADAERFPVRLDRDPARDFSVEIDGQAMTAAAMRARAMETANGEWRVDLALCDGRKDAPPLFDQPLLGDVLEVQLRDVVRRGMAHPAVVRIDHASQRVHLWRGLAKRRAEFVRDFELRTGAADATLLSVLMDWADPDRRRELAGAIGYALVAAPRDAALNQFQPPEADS
jgi:hypothetical protein